MERKSGSDLRSDPFLPKLRKNRRLEQRWGSEYYIALVEAVFKLRSIPYMPTESPCSLSEDVGESEPLYVCKECKDCFRFQSSYEDHINRRSWILGYWCQYCFLTLCSHVTPGQPICPPCEAVDYQKRTYLRSRGFKKGQKLGATKIFYNQCQFFAHLKAHSIAVVDMSDIMLMPIPLQIMNNFKPEIDILCEALMERTFLSYTHIMDWLKSKKIENNWWELINNPYDNDISETQSLVMKIYKTYQGRNIFSTTDTFLNTNKSNEVSPKGKIQMNVGNTPLDTSTRSNSYENDQNVVESEDNPCTVSDMSYVECESPPKIYIPKKRTPARSEIRHKSDIAAKKLPKLNTISTLVKCVKLKQNNKRSLSSDQGSDSHNKLDQSTDPAKKKAKTKPIMMNDSKVKVINSSPNSNSTKYIVFIGNDAESVKVQNGNAAIQTGTSPNKTLKLPVRIAKKISDNVVRPPSNESNNVRIKTNDKISKGQLLFQNGQKIIVKNLPSTSNIRVRDLSSLQPARITEYKISKSTFSENSSPIRASTPVRNENKQDNEIKFDFEHLSLKENEDGTLRLNVSTFKKSTKMNGKMGQLQMAKFKREMIESLSKLSPNEALRMLKHLKSLNEKYKEILNLEDDDVLDYNRKTVNELQSRLPIPENMESLEEEFETSLINWETNLTDSKVEICDKCELIRKPPTYAPGLSKMTGNESMYCNCYKYICHQCLSYQGSEERLAAHLNYHMKTKPYICTDCSHSFQNFDELEVHTWTSCPVVARKRVLGCSVCDLDGFTNIEALAEHFAIVHSSRKVTCEKCYLVFQSQTEYEEHSWEKHNGDSLNPMKLVVCKIGDCVVKYEDFAKHLEGHFGVRKLSWLKCAYCDYCILEEERSITALKTHLFSRHLSKLPKSVQEYHESRKNAHHGASVHTSSESSDIRENESECQKSDPSSFSEISINTTVNISSNECSMKKMDSKLEEEMKINESSLDKTERERSLLNITTDTPVEDNQDPKHRKPPPLVRIPHYILEEATLPNVDEKSKDIAKTKQNSQTLTPDNPNDDLCHLCGQLLETTLHDHLKTKHVDEFKLAPRLRRLSSEDINDYKQSTVLKKRKTEVVPSIVKKRRRMVPSRGDESFGQCVTLETPQDDDGKFVCKKCSQRLGSRQELHEHIAANHRIKGRYLICLECGDNFAAAPSLQIHLTAFHGIDDPITYLTQNTLYAPDMMDDPNMMDGESNQCHVCNAVFENKAAVDKHLRVHGMAFLNRKRFEARNASNSISKPNAEPNKTVETKPVVKRDNPSEKLFEKFNAAV